MLMRGKNCFYRHNFLYFDIQFLFTTQSKYLTTITKRTLKTKRKKEKMLETSIFSYSTMFCTLSKTTDHFPCLNCHLQTLSMW